MIKTQLRAHPSMNVRYAGDRRRISPGTSLSHRQRNIPSTSPRSAALVAQRSARTRVVRVQAAADVSKLQAQFGIPDAIEVVAGRGGLPTVVLKHACGSSAEVVLFGGCVTSWKQSSGDEVLYIRPDAKFDGSKPISGGIPHCFPQLPCRGVKDGTN